MSAAIYLFLALFLMAVSGISVAGYFNEGNEEDIWAATVGCIAACVFLHAALSDHQEGKSFLGYRLKRAASVFFLFIASVLMACSSLMVITYFRERNEDYIWAAIIGFVTACGFFSYSIQNRKIDSIKRGD
jgi:uncharacterized membrane protein HdeD (DUF308 family)